MNQLQKGSRGEDVKALQQMLRDAGYFKYPSNTGYFGDITEKALRDFQQANGLKIDGLLGDRTTAALKSYKQNQAIQSNPNIPQEVKQILDPKNGDSRVFEPYNATLSDADYAAIRQRSEQELEPFYNAQKQYEVGDAERNINDTISDYDSQVSQLRNQAVDDANDQDNTEGVRGTWASSARKSRMNSLQNKYNTQFSSLFNQGQKNLGKLRTDLAYQYGDSAIKNNSTLSRINTDLSKRAFNTDATGGQYNPFGFEGRRNVEKATNTTNYANNLTNKLFTGKNSLTK